MGQIRGLHYRRKDRDRPERGRAEQRDGEEGADRDERTEPRASPASVQRRGTAPLKAAQIARVTSPIATLSKEKPRQ